MKQSDEWQIPNWLFEQLDAEFHFDIDLCATADNTKCKLFYMDYLQDVQMDTTYYAPRVASMREYQEVGNANYICFMNPPYSNPKPFIEKAWEDSKHCKIIALVKCDPSTKWWATFWDYGYCEDCMGLGDISFYKTCVKCKGAGKYNGPKPGCEVRFFPKRIKFEPPKDLDICTCNGTHKNGYYIGNVRSCYTCKKKLVSGPTLSSALIIMDRRGEK